MGLDWWEYYEVIKNFKGFKEEIEALKKEIEALKKEIKGLKGK